MCGKSSGFLELSVLQCCKVIKAGIVLHNRAILANVPLPQRRPRNENDDDSNDGSGDEYEEEEDEEDEEDEGEDEILDELSADDPEGLVLRRRLVERFFS